MPQGAGGLEQDAQALTEQRRAMDKGRLVTKIGTLSGRFLRLLEQAIRNALDMCPLHLLPQPLLPAGGILSL